MRVSCRLDPTIDIDFTLDYWDGERSRDLRVGAGRGLTLRLVGKTRLSAQPVDAPPGVHGDR